MPNLQPDPHYPGRAQFVDLEVQEQAQTPRDYSLSWLRTTIPVLWGALLAFLATRFPAVHGLVADNPHAYLLFEGVLTVIWYSLWRAVEKHLPAWLTTLLMGANPQPVYVAPLPPARDAADEVG